MKALDILIATINAQLAELNKSDFKIYDADNQDYYITKVRYNKQDDRLYFDSQEDR
ncbi:MAG: hypothetical protein ACLTK7_10600 [Clostridium paraputrificum]